jgi:hypothetical protein
MKYIKIHPALVLLIAVITCGLMEDTKADSRVKGAAIINATKSGMPVARKQRIGKTYIYTARAKEGFCWAVKGEKIAYMSNERAVEFGAVRFRLSHLARKAAKLNKSK